MYDVNRLFVAAGAVGQVRDRAIFNDVSSLRDDGAEAQEILEQTVSEVFASEMSAKSIKKLLFHYNFIQEITFWLSDFFNKGVPITVKVDDKVDNRLTEYFNEFIAGPAFNSAIIEAEQLSNIMGTAVVEVQPRIDSELGIDFNVLHGGDFFFAERFDNRKVAEAIAYEVGSPMVVGELPAIDNPSSADIDNAPRGPVRDVSGMKNNSFICVTKKDYFYYDGRGNVTPVGSNKTTKNPFGYYTRFAPAPFCCLHSKYSKRFIAPPPVGLKQFDILNSVSIAELNLLHKLQTYSIPTFINAKYSGSVEVGPDIPLQLTTDGTNGDTDFKFVTPNPHLKEGKEFVREILTLFGKTFGISPTDMNVEGVAESGFAVRVKRSALDKRLRAVRDFRRIFLTDILRVMKDCNNMCLRGRDGFVEIPVDAKVDFVLPDITPLETEIERRTRLETDKLFALSSPSELVRDKLQTLSKEEALQIATDNISEWEEVTGLIEKDTVYDSVNKEQEVQYVSQPKAEVDPVKEQKVAT